MGLKIPQRIHLIGIGGKGMHSIAKVLLENGKEVSGSDVSESEGIAELREQGARIEIGHHADHLDGAQLVVVSTAISPDNPEWVRALERGIDVVHRSDLWAHVLNSAKGIAVAGAHGKTTITSLIAWVLHEAGLEPTFLIGGEVPGLGAARSGRGEWVVAEADESDGSFLRYTPWCSVVTSIEADHLEHYEGSFERLVDTYRTYLQKTRPEGFAVLCLDDERLRAELPNLPCRSVTYGLAPDAEWSAAEITLREFGSSFVVTHRGERVGSVRLSIPGLHNVQNGLAAIAVAHEIGVSFEVIAEHLATFQGAKRRFECIGEYDDIFVIDDYAHHPSEIEATLRAARRGWPNRRVVAVFQPHRYSRTHVLFDEFSRAFADADIAVITGVYAPPPEKPIPGVSGRDLARRIQSESPHVDVRYVDDVDGATALLLEIAQPGDMLITMGAGDIWRAARRVAELLPRTG